MKTWNNVNAEFKTSIGIDGEVYSADWDDIKVPQALAQYIPANAGTINLVIVWQSSGENDPGCRYERDGSGTPPSGYEERTLSHAYLVWKTEGKPFRKNETGARIALPQDVAEACYEAYRDQIEAEDCPAQDSEYD